MHLSTSTTIYYTVAIFSISPPAPFTVIVFRCTQTYKRVKLCHASLFLKHFYLFVFVIIIISLCSSVSLFSCRRATRSLSYFPSSNGWCVVLYIHRGNVISIIEWQQCWMPRNTCRSSPYYSQQDDMIWFFHEFVSTLLCFRLFSIKSKDIHINNWRCSRIHTHKKSYPRTRDVHEHVFSSCFSFSFFFWREIRYFPYLKPLNVLIARFCCFIVVIFPLSLFSFCILPTSHE